jgi:hypothetical protein
LNFIDCANIFQREEGNFRSFIRNNFDQPFQFELFGHFPEDGLADLQLIGQSGFDQPGSWKKAPG